MTQIDAASRLAALIRQQMSAGPSLKAPHEAGCTSSKRSMPAARNAAAASPSRDVAAMVALRVQSIASEDPQRERKAFGMFLHTVLLARFGEQLINDPGFHQIVEEVHRQMETDPDLVASIRQATKMLLDARGP
jgi:hypothetical protein